MSTLLLRNLDDHLVAEIKRRAATNHQSVQQYLREFIRLHLQADSLAQQRPLITVESGNTQAFSRDDIYAEDDRG